MRGMAYFAFVLLVLAGCQATDNSADKQDYLDLTNQENSDKPISYWTENYSPVPAFPISAAKKSLSGCVTLSVNINTHGKIDGYKVIHSYPGEVFVPSVLAALKKWRWEPTEENPERVPAIQIVGLTLEIKDAKNKADFRNQCEAFVQS